MTVALDKTKFLFWGLPEHDKHVMEKIGDKGLYPITRLPKIVLNFISNPKVIVVASGLGAASTWTYVNYPDKVLPVLRELAKLLPHLPIEALFEIGRGALWGTGFELIAALTARTYGRFAKKETVDSFWHMIPPVPGKGDGKGTPVTPRKV